MKNLSFNNINIFHTLGQIKNIAIVIIIGILYTVCRLGTKIMPPYVVWI